MADAEADAHPSQVTDAPWLRAAPPHPLIEPDAAHVGKWMIFVPTHLVDVEWRTIRRATEAGRLGIEAKVATAYPNPLARSRDERPIMIYTRDWRDEDDVQRVIAALRAIGVTSKAWYKRDADTRSGHYGGGVSVYVSPPAAAWFEHREPTDAPAPMARSTSEPPPTTAPQARPVPLDPPPSRPQRAPEPTTTLPEAVTAAFSQPGPLLDRGASARLNGDVAEPGHRHKGSRWRTLPSGPGGPGVHLSADVVRRIVEALERQGAEQGAEVFLDEFGESYGFWPDLGAVRWLRVWPEGAPEPD